MNIRMQRFDFIQQHLYEIKAGVLIVLGSIVHALIRWKKARDDKEEGFTLIDFLILIPIAGFTGLLFLLISKMYFPDPTAHLVFGGIGSVAGIVGLNKLTDLFVTLVEGASKGKK